MAPTTTAITTFKATPNSQSKNHNSNENNHSTPRKAGVDVTTSPGVIQPQATVPSVEVEAENIRPPPPGISAEGTGLVNQDKDRDARAYERERQRAKQAGEWAKRRARKATAQGTFSVGRQGAYTGRRAKGLKGSKVDVNVDLDVHAALPRRRDIGHTTAKIWASLPGGGGTDTSKAAQGIRVNLSDLVVLSQRRPRKLNVDDFEVIPPIRSVIALDDVANIHDMDLDEPWEHIYANDGEGKVLDGVIQPTGPSYAYVVGTGCK